MAEDEAARIAADVKTLMMADKANDESFPSLRGRPKDIYAVNAGRKSPQLSKGNIIVKSPPRSKSPEKRNFGSPPGKGQRKRNEVH